MNLQSGVQRFKPRSRNMLAAVICLAAALASAAQQRSTPPKSQALPTGMDITPTAAPGAVFESLDPELPAYPDFRAGGAVSTAISPDARTLLVLTSGYNVLYDARGKRDASASTEYVFVYDVTQTRPRKTQVLRVANTYVGLAWHPNGRAFFVSGGMDDVVHEFRREGEAWREVLPAIPLGHSAGLGIEVKPLVAGLAVSPSGAKLLAANYESDSVSLVDLAARKKIAELDLRPGKLDPAKRGVPGGEFPYWVVWKNDQRAFISCQRDREITELHVGGSLRVVRRIALPGQPARMAVDRAGTRLFVALHSADQVAVVDTSSARILERIRTTAPARVFANAKGWKGSNPNSVALSPDERLLFVTNGAANDLAIVALGSQAVSRGAVSKNPGDEDNDQAPAPSRILGLIPTGFYPTSVSVSRTDRILYVVNSSSPAGPVPQNCRNTMSTRPRAEWPCKAANQYVFQREHAGLLSLPLPRPAELEQLTVQVARNNRWTESPARRAGAETMALLRSRIKHVIYIVKENRAYDQVLGDLEKGNGDPKLTLFPEPLSPNHHQLARQFVTLDNFYASGGVSGTGWVWSTAARSTDPVEINVPVNYAARGLTYDSEGSSREVNVGLPTLAGRRAADSRIPDDPDLLPGTADYSEPEAPEGEAGAGYLWDGARRAGLSIRNYGFFLQLEFDLPGVGSTKTHTPPEMPWETRTVVAYPTKDALRDATDPYFHGFDMRLPDFFLYKEWEREFTDYERDANLPALTFLRLPHDHFGNFAKAVRGVNTVETQMADNDYAIGLVAERVARSRYARDTLIFVIEDDAQDGPDHVDAHRTIGYVIGPYVKHGAVVSARYTTVHMLRTIEDVLGIEPLGLFDAAVEPMADVFDPAASPDWNYTAIVPEILRTTQLPLPPRTANHPSPSAPYTAPGHDAAYWEEKMRGLNFEVEDKLDTPRFNRALWKGLKGERAPYPLERDARNLRRGRSRLLEKASRR
jgi:DNA-binding beta-propeller fold protein YncE